MTEVFERYLLSVSVDIKSNWSGVLFTGKLVKSLLIDAEPRLKKFFEKTYGNAPKLIHVTPLYMYIRSNKVDKRRKVINCVYSYVRDSDGRAVRIKVCGKYTFYVGFVESEAMESPRFNEVYNALLNLSGRHRFKNQDFSVELVSAEVVDVHGNVKNVVKDFVETGKIRVVFASPTLLRDPLRSGKHKSFTPTPMNIFSTPVYINLYLTGRFRQKYILRILTILHRVLNEPYSIYRTVKLRWVKYEEDKNPIPTLVGYVNLYINKTYYDEYSKRVDVSTLLEELLLTITSLGTGTSRATGFGHILISGS